MKLLFDVFPVIVFFICFKIFGIYTATAIAMAAALLQVLIHRIRYKQFEKAQLISLSLIVCLGGATLVFQNPWFIKWKPTAIYWVSSLLLLGSDWFGKKTIIQKMMEGNISLPTFLWKRLNLAWSIFFIIMGAVNLYVAYHYDTNTWVNFKLFGGVGLTFVFILLQAVYLTRHMVEVNPPATLIKEQK